MMPGERLISGVEPHWDDPTRPEPAEAPQRWRIYVGPRWSWKYIVVDEAEARRIWQAFNATHHLYARIPDDPEIFLVPMEDRLDDAASEKARILETERMMRRSTS